MKAHLYKLLLPFSLLILLAETNIAVAQYCTSNLYTYGCTYGDYIDNVAFGSLNQTATGCTSGNAGYSDFTALSTDLEQGSSYTLTVSTGTGGQYVSMWIDLDNDQNFEISEKLVSYLYCPTSFTNYTATFLIPAFATPGYHRMRIRSVTYGYPPLDPCLQYYYGETHDYTAHITPPVNMSFLSSTTTQNNTTTTSTGSNDVELIGVQVVTSGSLNPLSATSITLNSTGTTNFASDVTNVKVYYTGNSSVFATTTLFGSSTNLALPVTGNQTLALGTNYFWVTYDVAPTATIGNYLDAQCTQINVTGAGNQVPTVTNPYGTRQINYCLPNNTNGCNFAYIDDVVLNSLSNLDSYCNGSTDGYIYYAPSGSFTTNLELGSTYSLTLEGPPSEPVGFGVWIDFNNDADFSDAGEFVFSTLTYNYGAVNGTISIPATATLGQHRIRIRAKDYGTVASFESCETFYYGEAEDYTITLISATPMVFVSATTTQNNIDPLEPGDLTTEIIGVKVITQGSLKQFNLTSLSINANGSTDFAGDVTNAKIYYTGSNPNFSATGLFGTSTTLPAVFSGNQLLNSGSNYFWVSYDISSTANIGDYVDAECTQLVMSGAGGTKVPDVTAPAGNRLVNYCTPSTYYGCGYAYIDDVIFNTLSNTNTGCNANPGSYINYDPSGNLTTSLEIGSVTTISLGGYDYDYIGFGVWIDYNNDGDFDDNGEFAFGSPFYTTGPQTGLITIPNNAAYIGDHRMRIRSQAFGTFTSGQACGLIFNNGESEDYTITLSAPGPMAFLSATTTQENVDNVSLGQPDVEIMAVQVSVSGSLSPFAVNSLTINSNGSSDFSGDVTNVKVYYSGTSPSFSTATLFGSSANLSGPITGSQALSTGTNYFWVAYDLSASGSMGDFIDAECTQIGMTGAGGIQTPLITAPSGYRVIDYCSPSSTYGCYYGYIDGVTFNTLSNVLTGCNGNTGSYIFYPPTGSATTSLALGEAYDIQLDGGPYYEGVGFGVWIDFNNDGDFEDNGEFVFSSPYVTYGSQTGTITMPSDPAFVGERRMRVRSNDYNLLYSSQSCGSVYAGESEDYTITLTPAVTNMSYVSSTTTQNNISTVLPGTPDAEILGIQIVTSGALNSFAATSFTVNSTGTSNFGNDVSNVKIYYTGNSSVFSTGTLFGSATSLSSPITGNQVLSAGTNYFWVAYDVSSAASLGNFIDAQCTQIVMDGAGGTQTPYLAAPTGSREINLCVPTYTYLCSSGDYIDNFTLNTLSNLYSGCNGNINNYIYYDPGTFTTTLQGGATYDLTIQSGQTYGQGFGIWIDYNNNAFFGDPGEFVYASPSSGIQLFTGAITLPVDPAFYGDRRMRVRCVYASTLTAADYCNSNFSYGEVEDYQINIIAPPTCTSTPVAGVSVAEPSILCGTGGTSELTLSGFSAAADITFQWQQSPDGAGWSDIPGATNAYYSASVSSSTFYRTTVTCTNSG
ncbi:MAG: GEVED domain-containing protein, partial [Chitinophagales bacterium]